MTDSHRSSCSERNVVADEWGRSFESSESTFAFTR